MHAQTKIARAELGEVVGGRLVGIEIVLSQVAPTQLPSLTVLAGEEAEHQQQDRYQGLGQRGRDHVIPEWIHCSDSPGGAIDGSRERTAAPQVAGSPGLVQCAPGAQRRAWGARMRSDPCKNR